MKTTSCTDKKQYAFDKAPRCGAKTKRNNGNPCRSPAVRGKNRCRIHGGAKGSGAQSRNKNALTHGHTTHAAKTQRREIREELKFWKSFQELCDVKGV